MKRFLWLLGILCFNICFAHEGRKVDSKVISATVFKDRAMVTREAELNLTKGNHTIIFSNLTHDLQDETVRLSVTGVGITKILDVKVERRFTTTIQNERIQTLKHKMDSLKFELLIVSDQTAVLNSKKDFIETLKAESIKTVNKQILMDISSTANWTNMLHFIDKNLNEIFKGLRKQSLIQQKINRQLEAIQKTINTFRGGKTESYDGYDYI